MTRVEIKEEKTDSEGRETITQTLVEEVMCVCVCVRQSVCLGQRGA